LTSNVVSVVDDELLLLLDSDVSDVSVLVDEDELEEDEDEEDEDELLLDSEVCTDEDEEEASRRLRPPKAAFFAVSPTPWPAAAAF